MVGRRPPAQRALTDDIGRQAAGPRASQRDPRDLTTRYAIPGRPARSPATPLPETPPPETPVPETPPPASPLEATAPAQPDPVAPPSEPSALHGLYGPGSEAWRLNREAALLLGAGPRALLLQIAHPLVAEGVDQHSDFRTDPWARLAGTLRSYLRIVYGTGTAARDEIRRLNELHRTVTGPIHDGGALARFGDTYAARDPELSLWVHATLIDSTLATVDAWLEPLSHDRRARFYAETLPVGRLFGVPETLLPADIDAFDAYVASMLGPDGPVHPTPTARSLAQVILHPPLAPLARQGPVARRLGPLAPSIATLLGAVPPGAVDWLLVPSIGLLPETTRDEYGLAWGAREQAISAWLVRAWGAWRPLLPTTLRWFPQALAADARLADPATE